MRASAETSIPTASSSIQNAFHRNTSFAFGLALMTRMAKVSPTTVDVSHIFRDALTVDKTRAVASLAVKPAFLAALPAIAITVRANAGLATK